MRPFPAVGAPLACLEPPDIIVDILLLRQCRDFHDGVAVGVPLVGLDIHLRSATFHFCGLLLTVVHRFVDLQRSGQEASDDREARGAPTERRCFPSRWRACCRPSPSGLWNPASRSSARRSSRIGTRSLLRSRRPNRRPRAGSRQAANEDSTSGPLSSPTRVISPISTPDSPRLQEIDSLHLQIRELKAKNAELEEQARIMKEEKATLVRGRGQPPPQFLNGLSS